MTASSGACNQRTIAGRAHRRPPLQLAAPLRLELARGADRRAAGQL